MLSDTPLPSLAQPVADPTPLSGKFCSFHALGRRIRELEKLSVQSGVLKTPRPHKCVWLWAERSRGRSQRRLRINCSKSERSRAAAARPQRAEDQMGDPGC